MIDSFNNKEPKIHNSCFIAHSADVVGDIVIGEKSNVWFGTVIRGDTNNVVIGKNTNIQDNCTLHVDSTAPLIIGDNVTVGHGVILHGCVIKNSALIGMGSIILNNAKIGAESIIGAGSLVTEGKEIPSGVLCMGSPARIIRELTEEEKINIRKSAEHYVELSEQYKK
ncbi:gamma carbonic anhydrase family protein [Clostridium lundense]|uniref:gamma carbonic anhydrase family protein n=1 Tax=Clostridium lundense TaxID=319475 RepID=UPI0004843BCC|nr:gamma carbonic anhydrase family protein [Clostridium lundense]